MIIGNSDMGRYFHSNDHVFQMTFFFLITTLATLKYNIQSSLVIAYPFTTRIWIQRGPRFSAARGNGNSYLSEGVSFSMFNQLAYYVCQIIYVFSCSDPGYFQFVGLLVKYIIIVADLFHNSIHNVFYSVQDSTGCDI